MPTGEWLVGVSHVPPPVGGQVFVNPLEGDIIQGPLMPRLMEMDIVGKRQPEVLLGRFTVIPQLNCLLSLELGSSPSCDITLHATLKQYHAKGESLVQSYCFLSFLAMGVVVHIDQTTVV